MNILIIPSAKVINEELQSRYGRIVPILIPIKEGIVLDKIYKKYEKIYDEIIVTVYENYDQILKLINLENYSKLKIKKVTQLKDIGCGILEVLNEYKNKNLNNVSINFGDTLVTLEENILGKNMIFYSRKIPGERWAYYEVKNNSLNIIENNNKLKYTLKKDVLIGFFNFINCIDLYKFLYSSVKESNKESLYNAIEKYYEKYKIEFVYNESWIDFGHLDNFLASQKIVDTRYFNDIKIDRDKNILIKRSIDREKFSNEIKWFLTLPRDLQWVTPRIYDYSLEWSNLNIKMEYYSYPTLHHLYLYGNHSLQKWNKIFEKLFYIQNEFKKYSLKLDIIDYEKVVKKIYIDKTLDRLSKLRKDKNFEKYFDNDFIINGKKICNLNKIMNLIPLFVSDLNLDKGNILNIIHGDYFFANILYEPTSDIVKLIDPRGDFGGYGIYGDIYYDLAKLSHSIDGMYDFIIEDLFVLEELNNGFNYKINYTEMHSRIMKLFYEYFNNSEIIKIKFIQALLFLSMIPLHKDKPKRQKVMLGVGIRLLYEINELEEKLND